jgi:hypothetical protein
MVPGGEGAWRRRPIEPAGAIPPVKLQYLGDSRDAFKWDLLHWLCTRASPPFSELLFVPLLTPDDAVPSDGRTSHARFPARPEIASFVAKLQKDVAGLGAVRELGNVEPDSAFAVSIHAPTRFVPEGAKRTDYWRELVPAAHPNCLVFLDPDNGFEIKTSKAEKWVRDAEVKWLLDGLPETSAVAVYQQWPHRDWDVVFGALRQRFASASYAAAVFEPFLAFILLAQAPECGKRLEHAAEQYALANRRVRYTRL